MPATEVARRAGHGVTVPLKIYAHCIYGPGTGTALLRAYHQILDHQARALAYLEAADLRTRQIYLRHGYILRPRPPDPAARWAPDVPDGATCKVAHFE